MQHIILQDDSPSPATTPEPQQDGQRQRINYEDLCVGAIVWLPSQNLNDPPIFCSQPSCPRERMRKKGYNHPVVILKIRQRKESTIVGDVTCTVAILSTFGGTSLEDYLTQRQSSTYLQQSLPIHQNKTKTSSTRPENLTPSVPFLHLERRTLHKQGYVRFDHTWEIPIDQLRSYRFTKECRAYHFRLDKGSYEEVMRRVGLPCEYYEIRSRLYETASGRFAALAKSQREDSSRTVQLESGVLINRDEFGAFRDVGTVSYGAIGSSVGTVERGARGAILPCHSRDVDADAGEDEGLFGLSKLLWVAVSALASVVVLFGWSIGRRG